MPATEKLLRHLAKSIAHLFLNDYATIRVLSTQSTYNATFISIADLEPHLLYTFLCRYAWEHWHLTLNRARCVYYN